MNILDALAKVKKTKVGQRAKVIEKEAASIAEKFNVDFDEVKQMLKDGAIPQRGHSGACARTGEGASHEDRQVGHGAEGPKQRETRGVMREVQGVHMEGPTQDCEKHV